MLRGIALERRDEFVDIDLPLLEDIVYPRILVPLEDDDYDDLPPLEPDLPPLEDDDYDDLPPLEDDDYDDLPPLESDLPPLESDLPPLEDDDYDDLPPLEPCRFETCFICQIEKVVNAKIDFTSDILDIYRATNAPQWICGSCRRNVYYRVLDAMFHSIEIYCGGIGDIEVDIYIPRL